MGYLVSQLSILLLVAAIIGFIFGWLLRRFVTAERDREQAGYWSRKIEETEQHCQTLKADVAMRNDVLRERDNRISALIADAEEFDRRHVRLEAKVAERGDRIGALDRATIETESRNAELRADLERQNRQCAEYEAEITDWSRRLRLLEKSRDEWRRRCEGQPQSSADDADPVVESVTIFEQSAGVQGVDDKDDLKKIRGIGPVLENTLNSLGIYRYAQLAALSAAEIQDIAGKLQTFPDRIHRDGWIDQARDLAAD